MQEYRCRFVVPELSEWIVVKSEESDWQFVALEFHAKNPTTGIHHIIRKDGTREDVRFALIEVEGHDVIVSRMFSTGIYRAGGVKNIGTSLSEIAQKFGWTHPVEELLSKWEGEEEY